MKELKNGKKRKEQWQKKYLENGLIFCDGNLKNTAKYLGFSVRSITNWLNKWPELRRYQTEHGQHIHQLKKDKNISRGL